ncbi:hypothetical protein MNB_ARC-1_505 [hydrothermal vent metagenome]|uniref:Uncharacterized protein n=1 Tax=hydrothermal vent metagenome TaxID=652676 RepID=A0A3B1DT91_9ZZZZ
MLKFRYFFNQLSIRDKILLFLMVPLLLFLLLFVFEKYIFNTNDKKIIEEIKLLKRSIKQIKNDKHKINQVATIQYIEQVAEKLNIQILDIKISNKSFNIHTIAKYNDTMNFIFNLEENMNIKQLTLTNDKKITMHGIFHIKTFRYGKKLRQLRYLPNPFRNNVQHRLSKFALNAIIQSNVSINGKWYTINDKIGKYSIKAIYSSYVELIYKNKIMRLSLPH